MGQLRLLHPPEHPPVYRGEVGRIIRVTLVLVDPGSTDCGIDDEDRHLLARDELFRKLHPPPAKLRLLSILRLPHRPAPEIAGIVIRIARHTSVTADPLACFGWRFRTGICRERIRLAVDDVGIAADQIVHRLQHGIAGAKFHFVFNQARLELRQQGIRLVRAHLRHLGLHKLIVCVEP